MNATFLPNGDTAITIQLGDEISIATSKKVYALRQAIQDEPIEGISELLPTYCALMIYYRPEVIRYDALLEVCKKRLGMIDLNTSDQLLEEDVYNIPVRYGGEFGVDLDEVAAFHDKTPQEIIDVHTAHDNFNYMMGFTPGLGYLGSENGLSIPRRQSPRLKVEEGAVIIWANQSIIFPITAPTGWNVLGRTPVKVFDMERKDPFLLKAGMWVRFRSITPPEFDQIETDVAKGSYRIGVEHRAVKL